MSRTIQPKTISPIASDKWPNKLDPHKKRKLLFLRFISKRSWNMFLMPNNELLVTT